MRKFSIVIEWLIRIALLPIALFVGWIAVRNFFGIPVEDSVVGPIAASSAMELLIAVLLLQAVFYPAPPWRNKPLISVTLLIGIIAAVAACWIACWFVLGRIIEFFGLSDLMDNRFLGLIIAIGWLFLISYIFGFCRDKFYDLLGLLKRIFGKRKEN
jgi:hypothetical protein